VLTRRSAEEIQCQSPLAGEEELKSPIAITSVTVVFPRSKNYRVGSSTVGSNSSGSGRIPACAPNFTIVPASIVSGHLHSTENWGCNKYGSYQVVATLMLLLTVTTGLI